jgi:tRNA pseudouridine55 synthase
LFFLDKADGISSNKALQQVRHLYGAKKAGHTGSLDPIATGLLPICFGQATKLCSYLLGSKKSYQAIIQLGQTTDTYDREGEVMQERAVAVDQAQLETTLSQFRGEIEQVPPMYSALKRDGQPLYKLARQGKEVKREARTMVVHSLSANLISADLVKLEVTASSGFYVRSLAYDLGEALGCGAHIKELRRTAINTYSIDDAVTFDQLADLKESSELPLLPIDSLLMDLPELQLNEQQHRTLMFGQRVHDLDAPEGRYRLYDQEKQIFAVGIVDHEKQLKTEKVFVL